MNYKKVFISSLLQVVGTAFVAAAVAGYISRTGEKRVETPVNTREIIKPLFIQVCPDFVELPAATSSASDGIMLARLISILCHSDEQKEVCYKKWKDCFSLKVGMSGAEVEKRIFQCMYDRGVN